MGATCCKDDAPPSVEIHHVEPVVSPSAPPPVEDPEALAEWLLERLLANAENEVALPVRPHSERLRSGARGFSVTFLRGFLRFLRRHGAHELQMAELCKQPGLAVSVCRLTASTGLSPPHRACSRSDAGSWPWARAWRAFACGRPQPMLQPQAWANRHAGRRYG